LTLNNQFTILVGMKTSTETIVSAFDAKTHLSRLLREVAGGKVVTITKRGKPMARLVPVADEKPVRRDELLLAFAEIRARVPGTVDVCAYVKEGRKR
jgi:prevent-host-death family protein